MCRNVFFWVTEYLNYFALIFFGIKLFLRKYDVQTGRKEWVENVVILVASAPIIQVSIYNFKVYGYSIFVTYLLIAFLFILIKILKNKECRGVSFSVIAIYIMSIRLIDLWIVAVIGEISRVSRDVEIDIINIGTHRIFYVIMLTFIYFSIFKLLIKNLSIFTFLEENKNLSRILWAFEHMGVSGFSGVYRFEYNKQLINYWTFYLVCSFVFVGIFLFYIIKIRIKEREKILKMRNDLMEANYISLQKVYNENKTLQHDYKNHMLAVGEFIKNYKNKEALNYINEYINYTNISIQDIKSGNDIIDIIVKSKFFEAQDKKINLTYNIEYLGNLEIQDIDMCALLGNLLDNAIEACEKIESNPEINLRLLKRNDMLMVQLTNTVDYKMLNKNEFFKSEKENLHIHGWGMKSIEYVVNKYGGIKEYFIKDNYIEFFINIPI